MEESVKLFRAVRRKSVGLTRAGADSALNLCEIRRQMCRYVERLATGPEKGSRATVFSLRLS
jgi:hypothetical protein